MSSLAKKYSEMVDMKPDNVLGSRKDAREFVKNYTKNPNKTQRYTLFQ